MIAYIIIFILIITNIILFGYIKIKKPRIIYKYPDNIDRYRNDVLNKIFELQQKYAWKAEDLYNLAHLSNFNNETLNALKEYSKFEGRATMCQDLIKEIENLNIYAKEKDSNL